VVEGFFLPDWAAGTRELIHTAGRSAFEQLQNYGQRIRPAFFISQRRQQEVHVIWHYGGCVEVVAFAVIMQAVPEDGVPAFQSEGNLTHFAECDE
jgi:hypothetical protein